MKITHLEVGGVPTEDRTAWAEEVVAFGIAKLQDAAQEREMRWELDRLSARCREMSAAGWVPGARMRISVVLEARARLKLGKTSSEDRLVNEVLLELPWEVVARICEQFQRRLAALSRLTPLPGIAC